MNFEKSLILNLFVIKIHNLFKFEILFYNHKKLIIEKKVR